jgi:amidohydrolase
MIAEGVLQNSAPAAIIGQHVFPALPVGKVGFRAGPYMASTDELEFLVEGKGGHGAMPHAASDAVLAAAAIVQALQQVASRLANPATPTALSIGSVQANGTYNVLPAHVHMKGTFRTHNEQWRAQAHTHIERIAVQTAMAYGCTCQTTINRGYPALINHPTLTANLKEAAATYLGTENVVDLELYMTGEDFAYYSQQIPACFYRLGTGNVERGITSGVHTSSFDIDEDALAVGAGLMAWLAMHCPTEF